LKHLKLLEELKSSKNSDEEVKKKEVKREASMIRTQS